MNQNDIPNIGEVRGRRNDHDKQIEGLKSEIEYREVGKRSLGFHEYQNCDRDHKILSEVRVISLSLGVEIKVDIKSEPYEVPHRLNIVDEEAIALRDMLNLLYPEKEFPIVYNGI